MTEPPAPDFMAEFDLLAGELRQADELHAAATADYQSAREKLEAAARQMNDRKAALRALVEARAAARLWP